MSIISSVLALLQVTIVPAAAAADGVGGACELCGQFHSTQAPVYVTDWETNALHRYGAFDCALEGMLGRYPWSRAALTDDSTGERITVTRVQDRWTVRPEEAVVVVRAPGTEGGCPSYGFFASRDEFVRYTKKHKKAAEAGPPPERLADFVEAFVGPQVAAAPTSGPLPGPTASPAAGTQRPPERAVPPWTSDAVDIAKAEGIMQGYPDGSFQGDGKVTRYEMAVIAERLLERLGRRSTDSGKDEELGMGGPGGAKPSTAELVGALEEDLSAAGADRGEVAAALDVLREAATQGITIPPAVSSTTEWSDVPADHWAKEAVQAVTVAGIMNGYPDRTFQGDKPLTRYEIAVIAARLLSLAVPPEPKAAAAPAEQPDASATVPPAMVGTPAETEMPEPTTPPPPPAGGEAEGQLSPEARAHLLGLKAQLMLSGLSEDEAERTLAPVQEAMQRGETSTAAPTASETAPTSKEPAKPEPKPTESEAAQAALPPPPSTQPADVEPAAPSVRQPNMMGVSGFLLTPSADTSENDGTIRFGISRALGSNLIYGNTSALGNIEINLTSTSGDLPSRILLGAKKQIWHSRDGRSRAAVGVLDATDELDTTIYGAYSRSFRSHFWTDEPHDWTLTVGLGGGDLLDGIFASAYAPLSERLAVGAEVVDFGDSGMDLNYGFEYQLNRGWHIKAGIVDGDLAAEASIETDL